MNLFQVSDFVIEKVQVRNQFSAASEQNVFSFDLFLAFDLFDLRFVLNQKLVEAFFRVFFPEIAVFFKISFDVFSVLDNKVEVVRNLGHGILDKEVSFDFAEIVTSGGTSA